MKFKIKLDTADLCTLLIMIMSCRGGSVLYRLGKILLADLEERFEEAANFSDLEHAIDLEAIHPDDLPYAVIQLETLPDQIDSQELKDFIRMIVVELRAEQSRGRK